MKRAATSTRREFLSLAAAGTGLCLSALACAGTRGTLRGSPSETAHAHDDAPACGGDGAALAAASGAPPTHVAANVEFPELQGLCDGAVAIAPAQLDARREEARIKLEQAGYAALIVEAGTNGSYLTGARWSLSERPLVFVLPRQGPPLCIAPAFERRTLEEKLGGQASIYGWEEDQSPYEVTRRALREAGIRKGRLAVDPAMRAMVAQGLQVLDGTLKVDGDYFEALRIIKSPEELALLRSANVATVKALAAVGRRLTPDMRESDASPLVHAALSAAGLRDTWALVLFGPNAAFPHGTSQQHALRVGDLALIDAGGSLHGYQSDISRTFAIGSPTAAAARAYETVRRAQSAALALLRAGNSCDQADAAARAVIAEAGYGSGYAAMSHRLGHGIGMMGHEAPYLRPGNGTRLAAGMTMSNEPGIYIPGELGVRIEDIIAITQGAPEVFGDLATALERT